jgi:dienelactone hydrolase
VFRAGFAHEREARYISALNSTSFKTDRMNWIDGILLLSTSLLFLCLIFYPGSVGGRLPHFLTLLFLVALVQYLLTGFYWQYIPLYVAGLILVALAAFQKKHTKIFSGRLLRILLVGVLVFTLIPWALFVPIPQLTKPAGDYAVGTRIFRWMDLGRDELITSDPHDKRNVVVQAWYPTQADAKGAPAMYMDGLGNLPEKIGILPSFIFEHYDKIDTYGLLNAPMSGTRKKWPVVIFLPGYGATRAVYTSLAAGLASHGYVVLTLDHPYEAAITTLSTGEVATTHENFSEDDPNRIKFMEHRLDVRVADVKFVLDQLAKRTSSADRFFSALDPDRLGIAGHSLGGASAVVAMMQDARIKAAANVDGTLYGKLPEPNGTHPLLLLESNKSDTNHYARYESGNQLLFEQLGGGYRYEMTEADHYSFTDVPYFLAPPARWLAGWLLKVGQIPKSTQVATVEILNTFFNQSLNHKPIELDSIAGRHQKIIRKAVK